MLAQSMKKPLRVLHCEKLESNGCGTKFPPESQVVASGVSNLTPQLIKLDTRRFWLNGGFRGNGCKYSSRNSHITKTLINSSQTDISSSPVFHAHIRWYIPYILCLVHTTHLFKAIHVNCQRLGHKLGSCPVVAATKRWLEKEESHSSCREWTNKDLACDE